MNELLTLLRQAFAQAEEATLDKIAVASIRTRLENVIMFCEYLQTEPTLEDTWKDSPARRTSPPNRPPF